MVKVSKKNQQLLEREKSVSANNVQIETKNLEKYDNYFILHLTYDDVFGS